MVNSRNILSLVILLLPCLLMGQSGFDTPGEVPNQVNPFILFATTAEYDTIVSRCVGAGARSPYIDWYSDMKTQFASRAYDGNSVASHDLEDEGLIAVYGAFIYMCETDSTQARDSSKVAIANLDNGTIWTAPEALVWKAIAMDILLYKGQLSSAEKDAAQDNLMSVQDLYLPVPGVYNNTTTRRAATSIILALSVEDRDSSWAQNKMDAALILADSLYSYATDSTGMWHEGALYVEYGCRLMLVAQMAYKNATTRDFMDDDYFPSFLEFYAQSKRSRDARDWPWDDSKHREKGSHPILVNPEIFNQTVATRAASQFAAYDLSGFKIFPMNAPAIASYKDTVAIDTSGVPSYGNEAAGVAMLRDWWSGTGYEFVFLSETFELDDQSNHEHWDTNSLFGFFDDSMAVVDPGYGQTPPTGFDHNTHFKDFSAHNVLITNEASGTSDKLGEFNHYLLEHLMSYVEGHSDLYGHSWDRGVLFWSGHWFTVFDWITDTDADNQYKYQWLLPGTGVATWSDNTPAKRVSSDTLGLETYVIQSLAKVSTIQNDDWRYEYDNDVYGGARKHTFYNGTFNAQQDTVSMFTIHSFHSGGTAVTRSESGSVVKVNLGVDTLRSAMQLSVGLINGSLLKGNGKMMSIGDSSGTVEFFAATDCDSLLFNSNYLFESNTNVDAILMAMKDEQRYNNRLRGIVENSTQPYTVSIYTGYKPLWVKINDIQLTGSWDGSKITFTVSATGRQSIEMSIPQKNYPGQVF